MNSCAHVTAACVFALLADWSAGQVPPSSNPPIRTLPLKILPSSMTTMSAAIGCAGDSNTDAPCPIPITIVETVATDGTKGCQAQMTSELHIKGTSALAKEKNIVWTLSPTKLAGGTLAFHPTHGILVITDQHNPQLHDGGPGNGSVVSDTQFFVKNRRNSKGESTYLPIILLTTGGIVSLCGAADPKIINE